MTPSPRKPSVDPSGLQRPTLALDPQTPSQLPSGSLAGVEKARLTALVDLLEDDAPATWEAVRAELLSAGRRARPALDRAARGQAPRRRARARSILAQMERREVLRRLLSQAGRGIDDLESALYRLAAVDDPHFDARATRRRLDDLGQRVRERSAEREPGLDQAHALVTVLAGEEGLRGPGENYHATDHVHLHRALELGRGLPLTLVAIYIFTARRAGLDATGVPLPGHVMCRLHAGERSMLVDPFHAGVVRTRKECLSYLMRRGLAPRPDWFRDADDAALFQRHVLNLANGHTVRGDDGTARQLRRVAETVARSRSQHPHADPESA
ncbi:transglutaminase-like domain-containing protein [Engelhardtia mirabilis]|uniref:Protein SirB1 N-terminal domain-containing protein n=1 Tax=Engelhardtia mirabilis TaxID=2528011 RepID=A0A518BHU1_9BACT|nr:hypothetical protein Pla133_16240 [Planctomycetes bacterium Pla133]QDV00874.1 hypothetical protein Pla86_16230 [Planctomycetes bacterium Pla86]